MPSARSTGSWPALLASVHTARGSASTRPAAAGLGWDAASGAPVSTDLGANFEPWQRAFNADDAPHWKWFEGGLTNACFNEVDRHVLAGFGAEAAFIFEGDRWDMSQDGGRGAPVDSHVITRKALLLETAKCAIALQALGLKAGERIALNLPNIPAQLYWTEAAKRLGIVYTPVFGGFSDKTLSDRIHDAGARIVITADGGYRNAQIVPFKTAYTDPALDDYVPVATVRSAIARAAFDAGPGRRATRSRCWPRWTRRWPAKSPCSAAMRCAVSAARCATWDAPAG